MNEQLRLYLETLTEAEQYKLYISLTGPHNQTDSVDTMLYTPGSSKAHRCDCGCSEWIGEDSESPEFPYGEFDDGKHWQEE